MNEQPTLPGLISKVVLEFPPPGKMVSTNDERRIRHWAARSRLTEPWRQAAYVYFRQMVNPNRSMTTRGFLEPCIVTVTLPFETNRRRDPHNYTGTIVKAIVDGLVAAGAWPDDTPEWVTVKEPILVVGKGLNVKIELEAR